LCRALQLKFDYFFRLSEWELLDHKLDISYQRYLHNRHKKQQTVKVRNRTLRKI
jgi:hypothetical protein